MSEKEPSFEVRERRRFADADPSEPEASGEAGATPGGSGEAGATPGSAGGEQQSGQASAPGNSDAARTPPSGGPSADESPRSSAEEASPAAEGQGEDDFERPDASLPDIPTPAMIQFMMANLAQLAWQNMGLLPNPATGKVETRMADARLAIDAFAALVPVMSPRLDEEGRREMQNALSNLRINYVEHAKQQTG